MQLKPLTVAVKTINNYFLEAPIAERQQFQVIFAVLLNKVFCHVYKIL